ncbi:MAG: DNA primase [Thermomicrobiales bacterium]
MARDAVAEIRERIDIVDLIQGYVPSLKRTGRSLKGLCPFHQENTPSFVVFPDTQNFHCFGCGKGGDLFTFYMGVEHVEFREALNELASRAGVTLDFTTPITPEHDAHRSRLLEINGLAATFYAHQLNNAPLGEVGRRIFAERGVTSDMVSRFGLGFAPDSWDALLSYLTSRNVTTELALEAGLVGERPSGGYYDRFRNRLIFPIRDRDGNVVGFGGRAIGDAVPKYLNSPQTPVFDKSSLVYGLDLAREAIRTSEEVVIVEGYMDVIAAHQFGYDNVVGAMGTALTEGQVAQIKRAGKRIVLALDADTAGQMATLRGLDTLRESLGGDSQPVPDAMGIIHFEKRLRAEIRIAHIPEGKDPDELIRRNPERWPEIVKSARPFLDFMIDVLTAHVSLDNAQEKSRVVAQLAPALQQISDRIVQGHYLSLVARKLDIDERIVLSEVRRSRIGGKTAATRSTSAQSVGATPSRRATEDYLVALFLKHHTLTLEVLQRTPVEEIGDARNREVIRLLLELKDAEMSAEEIVALLDDGLIEHAENLLHMFDGRPEQFPGQISREASQVLELLGLERFRFLIAQLNTTLQSAQQDKDQDAIDQMKVQISLLAERHRLFYPPVSPYFRDSRSPQSR